MGSISSSLAGTGLTDTSTASNTSASTSSNPTGIFTGTSTYSQDLQNVITRAVQIASLPVNLLTTQQTALNNQSTELNTLDTKLAALQSAVQGITKAMGGAGFQATVSNPQIASVSLSDGASQGVYSVNVLGTGAYAASLTSASWNSTADPSGPTTYTLMIGSTPYKFTPSDDSASTVAAAINAQYGNLVHASAVNVGPAASPDWRVSLQSSTLADQALDIQRNGASLQTQQQPPGSPASYEVDNSGVTVQSATRTVTISNGVTVNLLSLGSTNITVGQSSSALSTALANFAGAYNAVVTELNNQHGQSAGPLQGQSIVAELSQALAGITTFSTDGSVNTLNTLGFKLQTDGTLAFDSSTFAGAESSDSEGVAAFLGSATGSGFLQAATTALTNLEDPVTGLVKTTETDLQTQIANLGSTISTKQDQIQQMELQMQNQMAQADALIASMQQRYSYMSSMFAAMQTANAMYAKG